MSQRAESSDAIATATTAQAVLQGAEPVAFEHAHQPRTSAQLAVGIAVLVVAGLLSWGALHIPSQAGYSGVGPDFLPWLAACVLGLCGLWLCWEALSGGYRHLDAPDGAQHGDWGALAWVCAGLLVNAALITTLGFIVSCTVCYALATQGLRRATGQAHAGSAKTIVIDLVTGVLIAAPVFWVFTQFLAINLPGLTETGWL
ncbi:tripartite tricarboxylate transporter TctB family protein [Comamonas sp. J-3]|uniref:tripartite tricarboxylate transporter TctB family protein n=1 Tax=Comamonas trifloxystrobinivorans TaxID=3350256 RepID=UPI0037275401